MNLRSTRRSYTSGLNFRSFIFEMTPIAAHQNIVLSLIMMINVAGYITPLYFIGGSYILRSFSIRDNTYSATKPFRVLNPK
jgi:hypothetical protein